MESHAFSKIDPQRLSARFRYDLDNPGYIRRPVTRKQPQLISDVIYTTDVIQEDSQTSKASVKTKEPTTDSLMSFQGIAPRASFNPTAQSHDQADSGILDKNIELPAKRSNKLSAFYSKKLQLGLTVLAVAIVLTGGYMSLVGFRANHIAVAQADKLTKEANKAVAAGTKPPTNALSTVKPTASVLASYVVAPNLPRYLIIPKLGVNSRILSVGVNSSGALATPNNVFDTAWYNESAEPGQPGATLIDGHISSWTSHGVFYGLKDLVAGDIIKVERGDGKVFTYSVVKTVVYPASNVSMTDAVTPVTAGVPGLNLISCDGDVITGTNTFNERIVVFSEQVGS
ncbi:MAG TPA: class F sortase [Candidatus Saccharimonadales bacterium]